MEPLLRPAEVRKLYKLSHTSLFQLEKDGILNPSKTPGGQRRYRKSDVDRVMSDLHHYEAIGYTVDVYFHDFGKLPPMIKIIGPDKPSAKANRASWTPTLEFIDPDTSPVFDVFKYTRLETRNKEDGTGWTIKATHPRVRSIVSTCVPKEIVLQGNGDTGITISSYYSRNHGYCPHVVQDDGTIMLKMDEIMRYLGMDPMLHSDEAPMFLLSKEHKNNADGSGEITPLIYECNK